MSIVRYTQDGSDVYVYRGATGVECHDCMFVGNYTVMVSHLREHEQRGDHIPRWVFESLQMWADAGWDADYV